MEKLSMGQITVENIDKNTFSQLIYNILPGGNTVLHRLHKNGQAIADLLRICSPNPDKKAIPPIETHFPFLENF